MSALGLIGWLFWLAGVGCLLFYLLLHFFVLCNQVRGLAEDVKELRRTLLQLKDKS